MLIKSELIASRENEGEEVKVQRSDGNEIEEKESGEKNSSPISRRIGSCSPFTDVTQIDANLFLCGAVAIRGSVLQDLKVTCVINATTELPDTPLPNGSERDILYLRVNLEDKIDSEILPWFDFVSDVIHQVKMTGGKCLVHCVAGISRSASLCLAYLIKYEGLNLYDSYSRLKSLRKIVKPNPGFFRQLAEYEKRITGRQTVAMVYSDYTNSYIPHVYEDELRRVYASARRRGRR